MRLSPALLRAESAAPSSSGLEALRVEIDRIDDTLLDLITRRLSLSAAIGHAKFKDGAETLLLRPLREKEILDRLTARSSNVAGSSIASLWRELMALSLNVQQRTEIVVHATEQPILVTDQARRRLGCAFPLIAAADPEIAMDRARRAQAVAVIEIHPLSSWWVPLVEDREIRIFDALESEPGRVLALAVGRIPSTEALKGMQFPILSEESLARRINAGDNIRPLALCGRLRLCLASADPTQPNGGQR